MLTCLENFFYCLLLSGRLRQVLKRCHRLNCDYSLGGVMGSVLMCIFNVD